MSVQNDGLDVEHITVTINEIIEKFKAHPSIKAINEHNHSLDPFHIPQPKLSNLQNILKNIDKKISGSKIDPSIIG